MQRIIFVLGAVILCLAAWASQAADTRLDRVDDRAELIGWEAVGRLDVAGLGTCTGTLIAPDLVLTAAHCIVTEAGEQVAPARIAFRAGLREGHAVAAARVLRTAIAPGYAPGREVSPATIVNDVALLKLDRGIATSLAKPFTIHQGVRTGGKIMVASYGKGRNDALSVQRNCNILGFRKALLSFDCDVTYGSSGAPVLAYDGIHLRVLSVVSAMRTGGGSSRGYGMELPAIVAGLRRDLAGGGSARPAAPAVTRRITVGDGARSAQGGTRSVGGAKFVSTP